MIELTRLNGHPLYVNCDLIKWAESSPDTMLTLINGEKVVVRESCPEVVERFLAQRARLLAELVKTTPDVETILRMAAVASTPQPWPRGGEAEPKPGHSHGSDREPFEPD